MSCLVRRIITEQDYHDKHNIYIDYAPYHADHPGRRKECRCNSPNSHDKDSNDTETKVCEEAFLGKETEGDISALPLPFAFEGPILSASGLVLDTVAYTSHYPLNWLNMFLHSGPREWIDLAEEHCRNPDGTRPDRITVHANFFALLMGESPGLFKAIPGNINPALQGTTSTPMKGSPPSSPPDQGADNSSPERSKGAKSPDPESNTTPVDQDEDDINLKISEEGSLRSPGPNIIPSEYTFDFANNPAAKKVLKELEDSGIEEHTRRAAILKGRKFIITEKGFMGLAPWYVRPGFKLAILLGCSVPVMLEELSEDKVGEGELPGLYFRGDCFVQAWMEGQMLEEWGGGGSVQELWAKVMKEERIRIN